MVKVSTSLICLVAESPSAAFVTGFEMEVTTRFAPEVDAPFTVMLPVGTTAAVIWWNCPVHVPPVPKVQPGGEPWQSLPAFAVGGTGLASGSTTLVDHTGGTGAGMVNGAIAQLLSSSDSENVFGASAQI